MEQMLSTGPKTWTRWERGKITQTRAADRFIRAIADDPYLARRLMRDAGVENPEAEEVFARIEHDERLRARAALRAELGRRGGILDGPHRRDRGRPGFRGGPSHPRRGRRGMTEKPTGTLHHLPRERKPLTEREELLRDVGLTIASQFREQNDMLRAEHREQAARIKEQGERLLEQGDMIRRLTKGVEQLVGEMHGVRTGRAEEAFARVGGRTPRPTCPRWLPRRR